MSRYFISAVLVIACLACFLFFGIYCLRLNDQTLEFETSSAPQEMQSMREMESMPGKLAVTKPQKPEDKSKADAEIPVSKKGVELLKSAQPTFSSDVPEWAKHLKHRVKADTHFFVVETGITSPESVEDEIDQKAVEVIQQYIERNFGLDCAQLVQVKPVDVRKYMYSKIHIRELTKDDAAKLVGSNELDLQELTYNVGYAEVRCEPAFKKMIASSWQKQKRLSRLQQFGIIGLSVLALVAIAFGFFASDKATRGMYTVRLQLATGVLVVVAAVVLWAVATQVHWI